ncbi:unnamed protein product [Ilex paraguariensis]|uniref:Uncharacterized protein n=1 Tax=Ilex paraguariensis TaxID=185542 RepID=A0ABC8QY05_9AQUA
MVKKEIRRIERLRLVVGSGRRWDDGRGGEKAEKCRQLVGEEAASKSGKFTFLNCFDGGSGTLACAVKEGVKLYFYSIRSAHVERSRNQAIETALVDALSQGLNPNDASKQAQKEGAKAAKLAKRQAKKIIGPIISSGWDFFEAIYYGGTMTEGFLRGTGTLFGAYAVGFLGEERFGRFGYLVGSHLGSWVGGRAGLMVYDVVNGVKYLLQFVQSEETRVFETPLDERAYGTFSFDSSDDEKTEVFDTPSNKNIQETSAFESSEASESPVYMSSEASEESNVYGSTAYESSEDHEEL